VHGNYETIDGRAALRFERRLDHPVARVWRAVTDPAELAHWFPAQVAVHETRPGGRLSFAFPDEGLPPTEGEITVYEPPRRFAFTWGDEALSFDLEPIDDDRGTRLVFVHLLSSADQAARDAAGWHVCLDRLARVLTGEQTQAPGTEPTDEWRVHYAEYQERGLPAGAPVPDVAD
jgi:uncharacterized protein YndB with AHSA1/START domain